MLSLATSRIAHLKRLVLKVSKSIFMKIESPMVLSCLLLQEKPVTKNKNNLSP